MLLPVFCFVFVYECAFWEFFFFFFFFFLAGWGGGGGVITVDQSLTKRGLKGGQEKKERIKEKRFDAC